MYLWYLLQKQEEGRDVLLVQGQVMFEQSRPPRPRTRAWPQRGQQLVREVLQRLAHLVQDLGGHFSDYRSG